MVSSLAVIVPFGAACVLAALSPFVRRRAGWSAVAVALVTLGLTIAVKDGTLWFGGWKPERGVAIGVAFTVDRIGGGFAIFVAALGVVALVVAARVIEVETPLFDALMLVFIGAMIGFCLTGDLFNLFVFFELMSVSAYVLVGYEIRHRAALEGALTFAVTNTVGSILLLFGIALLYGRTGALNLAQMGHSLGAHDALIPVSFGFVACGLLVKAAVVPFHLWTADAYAVAPTPVCILLAGAFSEMGLYGLARVYWTVFEGALHPGGILIAAGVVTGVVGALMCAAQHHLKRMLAFATIAHVGLFLVGLGLLSGAGVAGVAVWVVADGLVKAALFVIVSVLQHRFGSVEVADLYGRGTRALGIVFVLAALVVAGLPPAGSFLGKAMVEDVAPWWVPAAMMVITGLVGGALLRAAAAVFWGRGRRPPRDPAGQDEPDREGSERVLLTWIAAALTAAAIAWGLVPGLAGAAGRAASAFTGTPAPVHGPSGAAYLYTAGALALAAARLQPPVGALKRLHSGRPGDYVAWTVAGAAVLGAALVLA